MPDEKKLILDSHGQPIPRKRRRFKGLVGKTKVLIVTVTTGLAVFAGIVANLSEISEFICTTTGIFCSKDPLESKFKEAERQLQDTDISVRINGIRSLWQLARDAEKFQPDILDVLASYIRTRAPWKPGGAKNTLEQDDVQKALWVIGRIPKKDEYIPIDLHNVDISGAQLQGAKLKGAIIWGSNLRNVNLNGAHLEDTDLGGVDLTDASFEGAHLEGAKLWRSHKLQPLRPSLIERTALDHAILTNANLNNAYIARSSFYNANLKGADLSMSILINVNLYGANLTDANLRGAEIIGSTNPAKAILCNTTMPDGSITNINCSR